MENEQPKRTPIGQMSLLDMDDDLIIRAAITEAIRVCGKERAQIADEMQALMGRKVTDRMLYAFTSEAKEVHRFPLSFARAFCYAVNDWTLLRVIVERAGYAWASSEDMAFADLGRNHLIRLSADEKISQLQSTLRERAR